MPIGIQNFQTLFQTLFPDNDIPYLCPDNLPLFAMIDKQDGLSGDIIDAPFLYGAAQGYSVDFNVAATQASTAPRAARATLRCSQAYDLAEFFDKDRALSDGEASYGELVATTLKGKFSDFLKNLDLDMHTSGTGYRGMVVAVAGQVNPFTNVTLATNQIAISTALAIETVFDQDMAIQAATYAGFPLAGTIFPPSDGRLPTTLSGQVQVTAVDAVGRVVTLSDASAFAVNSFIVAAGGAIGFSASNTYGAIIGMDAWNPYGGVSQNDAFCGVNRSIYATRMAGSWFDGSRLSIEDALKRSSAKLSQGGARETKIALVNPMDFDALDSKLSTNVRYGTVNTATYGFDSIVINGAAGRMDVVSDPHQPQGYGRLIDPSTWVFHHRMAVPHVVEVEDRQFEQGLNFDGRTCRIRMYGQLRCRAPHKNAIVKLPQVSA